ncbi:hypothetical protein [Parasedimentitalea denitrificans]|uniref:hypothetical protein n=1 Tax=Parasedimentitalea denitrificans TaxID=2211118 RepID=UPI001980B846|nr:hypothetical protein [Sedimentitalea sp. CY04]
MELKEFIREAIVDIAEGIREADDKLKSMGGLVNPGAHKAGKAEVTGSDRRGPVIGRKPEEFVAPRTTLKFDVAVSAASDTEEGAGASAKIWVFAASVDGKTVAKTESVSRLSFDVDVVFPHDKDQKDRAGLVQGVVSN